MCNNDMNKNSLDYVEQKSKRTIKNKAYVAVVRAISWTKKTDISNLNDVCVSLYVNKLISEEMEKKEHQFGIPDPSLVTRRERVRSCGH